MKTKICRECGCTLNDINWCKSRQEKHDYLCYDCAHIKNTKDRESKKKYNLEYRKTHSEEIYNYCNSDRGYFNHLKTRGMNCSFEHFKNWYDSREKKCVYCGIKEEDLEKVIKIYVYSKRLQFDRKDNDRGYDLDNIVLSCYKCNLIKNDFFTYEEMKEIGKEYVKPKWIVLGVNI